jgi:hypothetical protein
MVRTVMHWTNDELSKIGAAEELRIALERRDGTLRRPVTIWVVCLGDDLYVRSVYGHNSAWYRAAEASHQGRIGAGGIEQDVTFMDVDADDQVNSEIDAAYRAKYHHYAKSIVDSAVTPQARAATLQLVPRSTIS